MRIHLASIFVDDQDKALRFYTEILGFERGCRTNRSETRCINWPAG